MIISGENGILIKPGDWEDLAENLQKVIEDRDLSEKMSEKAAKIQKEFNPEVINRSWKEYLERIMQG